MNPTVGVVSRLARIDIPFLSEWLEYYDKLGIDHFYLFYVDDFGLDDPLPDLEANLSYYPGDKITLRHVRNIHPNHLNSFVDLENIRRDYLLHVDSDEFLYLEDLDLKAFFSARPNYDYFRFPWVQCISQAECHPSLNDILASPSSLFYGPNSHKSAARRKCIRGFENPHDFMLTTGERCDRTYQDSRFYIIHFRYRGYLDLYNKYQRTNLVHDRRVNDLMLLDRNAKGCSLSEISARLLLYALEVQYAVRRASNKPDVARSLGISSKTNTALLRRFEYPNLEVFRARMSTLCKSELFDFESPDFSVSRQFVNATVSRDPAKFIRFDDALPSVHLLPFNGLSRVLGQLRRFVKMN